MTAQKRMKFSTLILTVLLIGTVAAADDSSEVTVANDTNIGTELVYTRAAMAKNDEARLIEHLLHGYKARGAGLSRPVADSKDRLIVTVKFIINDFEGIDDVAKRMRLAGMLKLTWKDIYLGWNPANFGGIDVIPLRGDNIYLPVIIRQSSAAEMTPLFSREGGMASLIWVDYKGNVFATVSGIFRTDCQIDFNKFPFDTQLCDFVFQVWQHSESQLQLKIDENEPVSLKADTSGMQAMWMIDDLKASEAVLSYDVGNFSAIVYTIKTSRRSVYYIWNLIIPCALLSSVQLAAFFMPYSPERVMFAITLVLSLHLFQESVARQLPATAEPIPMVKYSGSQMMIGILVTIESVFMLYALEMLCRRRIPAWLRKFRNTFYTRGRLSFLKALTFKSDEKAESGLATDGNEKVPADDHGDTNSVALVRTPSRLAALGTSHTASLLASRTSLTQGDRAAGLMTTEEKVEREEEWKDTILMFDRVVFAICLAATIGIPASVFLVK